MRVLCSYFRRHYPIFRSSSLLSVTYLVTTSSKRLEIAGKAWKRLVLYMVTFVIAKCLARKPRESTGAKRHNWTVSYWRFWYSDSLCEVCKRWIVQDVCGGNWRWQSIVLHRRCQRWRDWNDREWVQWSLYTVSKSDILTWKIWTVTRCLDFLKKSECLLCIFMKDFVYGNREEIFWWMHLFADVFWTISWLSIVCCRSVVSLGEKQRYIGVSGKNQVCIICD